jgi:hypothetical protein
VIADKFDMSERYIMIVSDQGDIIFTNDVLKKVIGEHITKVYELCDDQFLKWYYIRDKSSNFVVRK